MVIERFWWRLAYSYDMDYFLTKRKASKLIETKAAKLADLTQFRNFCCVCFDELAWGVLAMRCRVLDSGSIERDQLTSKSLSDAPCLIRVCQALFVDGCTCLTVWFPKAKCHIFCGWLVFISPNVVFALLLKMTVGIILSATWYGWANNTAFVNTKIYYSGDLSDENYS